MKIVQTQINDTIAYICDLIHFLQTIHNQITNDPRRNLGLAKFLQLRFDLPDQTLDIRSRNRPLGTGNAYTPRQLLPVEFFPRSILLENERRCQDRSFISAEALPAFETFAAPADSTMAVVRGIEHFRVVMLTVWTPHS